jgi:methylglutaconyl-CoA hydratase
MTKTILRVEHDSGVARLTMARPERHNAFDEALIAELTAALEAAGKDPAVRVVVLAGEGKSFSAGADLAWMQRMAGYDDAENLADARRLARLMQVLDTLSKPTVARVQGAVYGGGVGLVACCDIAVAATSARFCLSEVKLGIIPSVISPYVVRSMGVRAARRYVLTSKVFDAHEAYRLGLVHAVDGSDRIDRDIDAIVAALLANGPAAMAEAKDLVGFVDANPIDDAMVEETAQRIARVRASSEGVEGVSAFLERRAPSWRGKATT